MNKKHTKFYIFFQLSPVHTSNFIFEQSLLNEVTTRLSFLKMSQLIFSAKYFESYFNLNSVTFIGTPSIVNPTTVMRNDIKKTES